MIDGRVVIHPSAKIEEGVTIGPWTLIGENVVIGAGTEIASHVVIGNHTRMGKKNKIYPYASIGTDPQHLGYKGEPTELTIGDGNTIREFVTINRGTQEGRGVTQIGNNNYIMAYAHIAHDCQVGNHIIFANTASLAGHVEVDDHAILGPFSGVHQFCRIGAYSFLGRGAKIYQDILPYMLVVGNPGAPAGLNLVGLRRHGFDTETMFYLKRAFRLICRSKRKLADIRQELEELSLKTPEIRNIVSMITTSTRGIARHNKNNYSYHEE